MKFSAQVARKILNLKGFARENGRAHASWTLTAAPSLLDRTIRFMWVFCVSFFVQSYRVPQVGFDYRFKAPYCGKIALTH